MKKIICLLLALVAIFAFVSCGECEDHTDDNKDGKCDECGVEIEFLGKAIFAMASSAEPTQIATIEEVSIEGVPYNRIYTTTIYPDGSFKHEYEIERPAGLDEESETALVVESGVIEYANGIYTVDGEPVVSAPEVSYVSVKRAINAQNITNYTVDGTGKILNATLTSAACKNIFGVDVQSDDIRLTLTTNGTRLTLITLTYTNANGVTVTSQTSYSYAPVSK